MGMDTVTIRLPPQRPRQGADTMATYASLMLTLGSLCAAARWLPLADVFHTLTTAPWMLLAAAVGCGLAALLALLAGAHIGQLLERRLTRPATIFTIGPHHISLNKRRIPLCEVLFAECSPCCIVLRGGERLLLATRHTPETQDWLTQALNRALSSRPAMGTPRDIPALLRTIQPPQHPGPAI